MAFSPETYAILKGQGGGGGGSESYPQYDAVFSIDYSTYTGTVLKGDYSTIRARLENKIPTFFGVFCCGADNNATSVTYYELQNDSIYFLMYESGWEWSASGFVTTD